MSSLTTTLPVGADPMTVVNGATQRLRQARSAQLEYVHAVVSSGVWVRNGYRSPMRWLANVTDESPSACIATLRLAERIQEMPLVKASFAKGSLAETSLRLLTDAWSADTTLEFARDEQMLLGWALNLPHADFKIVLGAWVLHADPTQGEKTAQEKFDARSLHISEMLDGMGRVDGLLDPEGLVILREAIRHLSARTPGDDRPRSTRQADALVSLAKSYLTNPEHRPGKKRNRPKLVATFDYHELVAKTGSGTLETDGGRIVITPDTVRRYACDGGVHRLVALGDGTILEYGRQTRAVSDSLFDVLALRDHGCRWEGCTAPASACDAHHVVHWVNDGETEPDNLVLLCWFHHHLLHEQHWSIEPLGGGQFTLQDPLGRLHQMRPPMIGAALPRITLSSPSLFDPPV